MSDSKTWNAAKPFVNGGISGMCATSVIQPIDMVKVRLQLGATGTPVSGYPPSRLLLTRQERSNRRPVAADVFPLIIQMSIASSIIKQDGFFSLYRGLSAGLLRQATYTTARLGAYKTLSDAAMHYTDGKVNNPSCLVV